MEHALTEPLQHRSAELRAKVGTIADLAGRIEHLEPSERQRSVDAVLDILQGDLRLHAEAEELFLFPHLARRLRHPLGIAAMEFDHKLFRGYVEALRTADPRDGLGLERQLYAISTLLDTHFLKEEQVYLPLLEDEDAAQEVIFLEERMAEHEGRRPVVEHLEPLDLERKEFPFTGSAAAKLAFLLRYAVLAPSSHNSQPWLYRLEGDSVLLLADRSRALPVADVDDRELEISCGAALFHLELAIRHHGFEPTVELVPDPADRDLLARVTLGAERQPSHEDRLLFWAIAKRHTNRYPFADTAVPPELLRELVEAAVQEGGWLSLLVRDVERESLAELVRDADLRQLADAAFRRELVAWIRNDREAKDGMPAKALGIPRLLTPVGARAIRSFGMGRSAVAHDRKLLDASPVLAVLGTDDDSTACRLDAGRALARVLLRATQDEVSASFLNQPVELEDLRPKVAALADHAGVAQLVLRFGYGPQTYPTPRRPVGDVLLQPS
jgi:iron-sulfur cluster repair protein YtfE (RIC family)